jgi:hypothetical protein
VRFRSRDGVGKDYTLEVDPQEIVRSAH